jgi:GTPase Era involved in 16S rRNA processing
VNTDNAAALACRERILELAERYRVPPRDLPENLHRTIRLLESFAGSYYGIDHFKEMREEVRRTVHSLAALGREPLKCAVIGEFNAGKSSLINALVGRDDFLPVNLTETTALVSRLEYAPFPRVVLELRDGGRQESSFADYRKLVDQNADSAVRQQVAVVNVQVDYPPLKTISIIDTPGLNSKIEEHERTTLAYLSEVEVVFWVFTAYKPAAGSELKYLDTIRNRGCKVYGIVNMIDTVDGFHDDPMRFKDEMDQVMAVFRKHCGTIIERFIALSANEALEGFTSGDRKREEGSNIAELRRVIDEEVAGKAATIRREHLAARVACYAGLGKATESYLTELFAPYRQGLEPFRKRLDLIEQEARADAEEERNARQKVTRQSW